MTKTLSVQNQQIRVDKLGYLQDISDWNERVAVVIGRQAGLELSQEHWEVIGLLRAFHLQSGLVPTTRALVKLMARELGASKGSSIYLMTLFPQTPLRLACKIAGLPRPANCL